MTVPRKHSRQSGQALASEVAAELGKDIDSTVGEGQDAQSEPKKWRTPGFSRMRTDWRSDDRPIIEQARVVVDDRILAEFADAYLILGDLFDIVRTQARDEHGELMFDRFHRPVWTRLPNGDWDEDWSRLSRAERETFMFRITTRISEWEQRSTDAWGEAMMAKAQWEERFAISFDEPMSGTVDDRTALGRIGSADERYFAIVMTWYSRRAESIVRSMQLLSQRLKDSLTV